ncbi:MAG: amino-acid N-acetyltransferase [Candidatus Thermoplasmatota archaeon]|nr:amino-acid N-acetyltransferase [Candidatus Thermoplasmatota archaeon]
MNPEAIMIRRTEDLDAMKALCVSAGLDMAEGPLEGVVVAYGAYLGDKLVGCATLQFADGGHFLEYVAVDASVRSRGIGASLVAKIEEEARARGMSDLWAKAKAPVFYERIGFRVLTEGERGPKNLDTCQTCPQFRSTCFPAIVVKLL